MTKLISTNPAKNYEIIGEVDISTEEDVKNVVTKARNATTQWQYLGVQGRIPYFEKFIELFNTKANELAELQTKETGKTISESKDEGS